MKQGAIKIFYYLSDNFVVIQVSSICPRQLEKFKFRRKNGMNRVLFGRQ